MADIAYLKEALHAWKGVKSPEAVFVPASKEGRKPETQQPKSATIANQTQGQVEQSNSASLLVENSVSGEGVKADHGGEGSAAPIPVLKNGRMRRLSQGQICDRSVCRN